jgi:hypothetical protein
VPQAIALVTAPKAAVLLTVPVSGLSVVQFEDKNVQLAMTAGVGWALQVDASRVVIVASTYIQVAGVNRHRHLSSGGHLSAELEIPTESTDASAVNAIEERIDVQKNTFVQFFKTKAAELGVLNIVQNASIDTTAISTEQATTKSLPATYNAKTRVQPSCSAMKTLAQLGAPSSCCSSNFSVVCKDYDYCWQFAMGHTLPLTSPGCCTALKGCHDSQVLADTFAYVWAIVVVDVVVALLGFLLYFRVFQKVMTTGDSSRNVLGQLVLAKKAMTWCTYAMSCLAVVDACLSIVVWYQLAGTSLTDDVGTPVDMLQRLHESECFKRGERDFVIFQVRKISMIITTSILICVSIFAISGKGDLGGVSGQGGDSPGLHCSNRRSGPCLLRTKRQETRRALHGCGGG